jgi:hypothetical protein
LDLVNEPRELLSAWAVGKTSQENNTMKYDNETVLLVTIFQKANPLEPQSSVAEYLHYFEFEIDRMGSVLQFLGLAKKSNQCDLVWAPNHRLMRIGEDGGFKPTPRIKDLVLGHFLKVAVEEEEKQEEEEEEE